MTKIDFYQIDNDETPLAFACRLIDSIQRRGHQVYVHTDSAASAGELDDLLWGFKPERFVPHTLVGDEPSAPITIGYENEPAGHHEVMVNLASTIPDFFSHFERVAEIVPKDPARRASARDNYKFYKDRGYTLDYHKMS